MKTTITDVAKRAGVSMKTVSRVLNNEPNVAQETRTRVKAAARDLNYSPNFAARGLASSRSFFIALIYDNPSPSYLTRLQRGAVQACRESGHHLVLEPMDTRLADPLEIEFKLTRLGVDGVILAPPLTEHIPLRNALEKLGLRTALISAERSKGLYTVGMDDRAAARIMTEHLLGLGHRDIGFIKGPDGHYASFLRFEGFQQALASAGMSVDERLIRQGDFTMESGVREGRSLLAAGDRPSAVFASNDDMAAGVINAAMSEGLNVPDDVSICGFDNSQIAEMIWPPLTTIAQPVREMGRRAAAALISRETITEELDLLDFKLFTRQSTGPKPAQ